LWLENSNANGNLEGGEGAVCGCHRGPGHCRIVVGTDGRPVPVKADLSKGISLRLLNWREVPAVN